MRSRMVSVALPLEATNFAGVREVSIRRGQPSTPYHSCARRRLMAGKTVFEWKA